MTQTTTLEQEKNIIQEPTCAGSESFKPNAFKIVTKKLSYSVNQEIKKRFNANWSETSFAWTVPQEHQIPVEAYLKKEGFDFTLEPIYEKFHNLTKNQQQAERLDQRKMFNVKASLDYLKTLQDYLKDYNSTYETTLKVKDFDGKSIEEVRGYAHQDNQKQIEHLNILFEIFSKVDEKRNETKKIDTKIIALKQQTISFDDILEGLKRNERGDAELFQILLKGKYLFDSAEGKSGGYYFWTGTHWQLDRKKQRYKDMEIVSDRYEKASIEIGKNEENKQLRDLLSKRAFNLRSSRRCKSVFDFVSTDIHLNGEWDHSPGKLPCLNGIIDLKTGELEENKPEYLIRSICPTKYNPKAERPLFDKFLDDITLGNNELKSFLGRILGAALIGNCKEEKVFIFYGENGRNGKGTLMQALEKVLGGLAKTFPSEMLLLQRNPPSSSTPRPEKANLQGVRFAIFSEINKGRKIDASEVKNLSGGDTVTCRKLFSNFDIQIRPSHTIFIQTNFKPEAPSDDGALWKRNVLFPFNAEFVEDPDPKKTHQRKLDEGFKEKLLSENEGILAWLVEGCIEYQKIGLEIPKIVRDETDKYRKENDGIGRFLKEMCVEDPIFSTSKSKMEKSIKEFCTQNSCAVPTRIEISSYLKVKFEEQHTDKGNIWKGVTIIGEREMQN